MTTPSLATVLEKLAAVGIAVPPGRVVVDAYGDSPELSRELVALIRDGRKRAGTSLLWAHEHEGEPLPEVGDVGVVVDHEGEPVAVTRVTGVRVVAFDAVDAAYAALEGEGDRSLAHWRAAHWDVFGRECASIGRAPADDMPVVCCSFELLAVVPAPEADPTMATDERDVLAAEDAYVAAEVDRDEAALRRLVDDAFVFNASSGTTLGKDALIENVLGMGMTGQTLRERTVRVEGSFALIFGTADLKFAGAEGTESVSSLRYTAVYAKRDDGWRMIALQMQPRAAE